MRILSLIVLLFSVACAAPIPSDVNPASDADGGIALEADGIEEGIDDLTDEDKACKIAWHALRTVPGRVWFLSVDRLEASHGIAACGGTWLAKRRQLIRDGWRITSARQVNR